MPISPSSDPSDSSTPRVPLCIRCAATQKTCCQTSEIYTTLGDVARISAYIGRNDFTILAVPADPVYRDQDDDPVWAKFVFRPDGARRILKRRTNGDCTFLSSAGCCLPLEVRPLVCRLYPYHYNHTGILPELAAGCPTHLLRPGETLLGSLDMRQADAQRWHAQLYAELPLEHASNTGWVAGAAGNTRGGSREVAASRFDV